MDIEFVKNHIRNRAYMSGVDRDKLRVRSTGEVFTPTDLVIQYINYCESQYPDSFTNPENNFCDNSCGDGQFLGEILIRKLERGMLFEAALESIYGIDFQQSNVDLCRTLLLCGQEHLRYIVEQNIVQANSLTYKYTFPIMSDTRRKKEEKNRIRERKLKEKIKKIEETNRKNKIIEVNAKKFVEFT